MALYNITAQTSVLKITLDTSGNDVQTKEQTFNAPSIVLRADKIRFYESGNYRTELTFTTIGEIDGETPTDIQDAANKINNLISANFNSGGATPQSLEQVLNVSDRPVILHDVTTGDFTFNTSHIGKYIRFYGEGICDAIIPDDTYDPAIWVNLVGAVGQGAYINLKRTGGTQSTIIGHENRIITFGAKLTDPDYNGWVIEEQNNPTVFLISSPLESLDINDILVAYPDYESYIIGYYGYADADWTLPLTSAYASKRIKIINFTQYNMKFSGVENIWFNNNEVSDFWIEKGNYVEFLSSYNSLHIIFDTNRSKNLEFQSTQSGTDAPEIVAGSELGFRGATATTAYESIGIFLLTFSEPILADLKDKYKQEYAKQSFLITPGSGDLFMYTVYARDNYTLEIGAYSIAGGFPTYIDESMFQPTTFTLEFKP